MSDERVPPVSFSSFIVSLAASAMHHLGQTVAPESGLKPEVNLTLARQTIGVIRILEQKTQGNLDAEEAELLGTLLGDLEARLATAEG